MRVEGILREVGRESTGGNATKHWIVVEVGVTRHCLPTQEADYERCRGMIGRTVTWDAYPDVRLVKTEAEWRAEETALLVDSLKARMATMTPEEQASALARLEAT